MIAFKVDGRDTVDGLTLKMSKYLFHKAIPEDHIVIYKYDEESEIVEVPPHSKDTVWNMKYVETYINNGYNNQLRNLRYNQKREHIMLERPIYFELLKDSYAKHYGESCITLPVYNGTLWQIDTLDAYLTSRSMPVQEIINQLRSKWMRKPPPSGLLSHPLIIKNPNSIQFDYSIKWEGLDVRNVELRVVKFIKSKLENRSFVIDPSQPADTLLEADTECRIEIVPDDQLSSVLPPSDQFRYLPVYFVYKVKKNAQKLSSYRLLWAPLSFFIVFVKGDIQEDMYRKIEKYLQYSLPVEITSVLFKRMMLASVEKICYNYEIKTNSELLYKLMEAVFICLSDEDTKYLNCGTLCRRIEENPDADDGDESGRKEVIDGESETGEVSKVCKESEKENKKDSKEIPERVQSMLNKKIIGRCLSRGSSETEVLHLKSIVDKAIAEYGVKQSNTGGKGVVLMDE